MTTKITYVQQYKGVLNVEVHCFCDLIDVCWYKSEISFREIIKTILFRRSRGFELKYSIESALLVINRKSFEPKTNFFNPNFDLAYSLRNLIPLREEASY